VIIDINQKGKKCILLVVITQLYHDARSTECQTFTSLTQS